MLRERHPLRNNFPLFAGFRDVEMSSDYYGKGYQDVEHRKPRHFRNAKRCLNWTPTVPDGRNRGAYTLDFFPAYG